MTNNTDNFKKLINILDEILKENNSMSIRAISSLHFIRSHPVFNSQYQNLFSSKCNFPPFLFLLYLKGVVNIFFTLFNSIINFKTYNHIDKRKKIDLFYVSHLINSEIDKKKDFYFDDIISNQGDKGYSYGGILINHLKASLKDDVKKIAYNKNNYILSNYLNYRIELKFIFDQIKVLIKFIFKGENDKLKRRVNFFISAASISRSTFLNIRLSYVFKDLLNYHKPKLVFITYEGHAWERVLCYTLKKNFPNTKIIGYQHSYIFKRQHAALNSFDSDYDPHYILTSGEISRERIIKSTIAKNVKVDILGSKRFKDINKFKVQLRKKFSKRIFVIPEGIMSECKILFDFCLNYSNNVNNIEFIFKLHPQISLNNLISKNPNYKNLPKNCNWFKNHFFKRGDWVLYRGSTFVVNLFKMGLQPIYLSHKSDHKSIDIFEGEFNHRKIISSSKDLDILLKKEKDGKMTSDKDLKLLWNFSNKIYSPVNRSILNKIIKEAI